MFAILSGACHSSIHWELLPHIWSGCVHLLLVSLTYLEMTMTKLDIMRRKNLNHQKANISKSNIEHGVHQF